MRRDLPSLLIVVVLGAVLGFQLNTAIARSLFESKVHAVLREHFDDMSGSYLIDVRFSNEAGASITSAVVRGTKMPSPEDVANAQAELPAAPNGTKLQLRVRFVEATIVTPHGRLFDGGEPER